MSNLYNLYDISKTLRDSTDELLNSLCEIKRSAHHIINTLQREIIYKKHVLQTLSTVFEDILILIDPENRIQIFNPAASALFGISAEDALGRDVLDVFPTLRDRLSGKVEEWKVFDQEQKPIYLEVSISKITAYTDGEESEVSKLIVARDITAKRVHEAKIVDQVSFQTILLESVPSPMFYTNLSGGYIRGSKAFYNFFGLTKEEALTRTLRDLFLESIDDLLAITDGVQTIKTTINHRGEIKEISVDKSCIKNAEGKLLGFIYTLLVSQESVCTQHCALSFVASLKNAQYPIVAVDWPSYEIMMANSQFLSLYSLTEDKLVGKDVESLLPAGIDIREIDVTELVNASLKLQHFVDINDNIVYCLLIKDGLNT